MGLDWHFSRITPEQHARLLNRGESGIVEEIHDERFHAGLMEQVSTHDFGETIENFDTIYELILRTSFDELEDLLLMEGDDGPLLTWPLGSTGVKLPSLGDLFELVAPNEVQSLAPAMQSLLDVYLDARFERYMSELDEDEQEDDELVQSYPELRLCYVNLVRFVQAAAQNGEAIMWNYT